MLHFRGRDSSFNRGYRGQRGHRRWSSVSSVNSGPTAPFGNVVKSLTLEDLNCASGNSDVRAQGSDTLASFNLMRGPKVSISVPGIPPKWTPDLENRKLDEDAGIYYRDVNAAHNPQGPWHATVETLMRKPGIEPIHILACGSTLGNLIRFVLGKPEGCRMLVNYIGGVVHLTRREPTPKTVIPDVRGYGHTFPEANTTWDKTALGSTSHQRVVRFRFAGLDIAVRSEADGYMPDKVQSLHYVSSGTDSACDDGEKGSSVEDLEAAFANLQSQPQQTHGDGALEIKDAGAEVPQHSIFDLKTRSIKRLGQGNEIVAGEIPRLWVRRISTLILAYHAHGVFTHIHPKDVWPEVVSWEEENQDALRRLAELLRIVISTAKADPSRKLEITLDEGSSTLHFREQLADAPPLFPSSTARRWEDWLTRSGVSQDSEGDSGASSSDDQEGVQVLVGRRKSLRQSVCDDECDYCGNCK